MLRQISKRYVVCGVIKAAVYVFTHIPQHTWLHVLYTSGNPPYHKVISKFHQLTGVPVLLNTSFNDSEPITCSPQDAINTFMKSEIDYLAIENFIVCKAENRQ